MIAYMYVHLYVQIDGGQVRRLKTDKGMQRSKLIFALFPLRCHAFTIFYSCSVKQDNFFIKKSSINFVRNIECMYSLEPKRF